MGYQFRPRRKYFMIKMNTESGCKGNNVKMQGAKNLKTTIYELILIKEIILT